MEIGQGGLVIPQSPNPLDIRLGSAEECGFEERVGHGRGGGEEGDVGVSGRVGWEPGFECAFLGCMFSMGQMLLCSP